MYKDQIAIASFYSFVPINNIDILTSKLLLLGKKKYLKGTALIAQEGVNGSICGKEENVRFFLDELIRLTSSEDMSIKYNYAEKAPFQKFKVKLKKEIVALGVGDIDVNSLKGEYIESQDWDEFIQRDDVVLVDTRNDYESRIGTFKDAIIPNTKTFREFPQYIDQNLEQFKDKKF